MFLKNDLIKKNLNEVRNRVASAAKSSKRMPSEVTLLAVTKGVSVEVVINALFEGQNKFGENYVQEAVDKIERVNEKLIVMGKNMTTEWHFISPIQSNKTKVVAKYFDWVHSVDRLKIAEKLSAFRESSKGPLNICIQVNTSGEKTKQGISYNQACKFASMMQDLPNLRLRGLMTIPTRTKDPETLRMEFKMLYDLRDKLNEHGAKLDTLSLGMSSDLELAIQEGSTMIRVGTAIFGPRG